MSYLDGRVEKLIRSNLLLLAQVEETAYVPTHHAKDQFGNYVLQHCMTVLAEEEKRACSGWVLARTPDLLFHKYGSNVLEKVGKQRGTKGTLMR